MVKGSFTPLLVVRPQKQHISLFVSSLSEGNYLWLYYSIIEIFHLLVLYIFFAESQ